MNETPICQSCGMPMDSDTLRGTEENGTSSEKYCTYCYQNGKFTQDITIDEMIENNLKYLDEWNKNSGKSFSAEEAKKQLQQFIPMLERWKK